MFKGDLEHQGIKVQRLQPRAKPFELYSVPWTSFLKTLVTTLLDFKGTKTQMHV